MVPFGDQRPNGRRDPWREQRAFRQHDAVPLSVVDHAGERAVAVRRCRALGAEDRRVEDGCVAAPGAHGLQQQVDAGVAERRARRA